MLAGLIAVPAFAQPQNNLASDLSIGMADNTKFTIAFDNAFYTTPSNTYNITAIQPGQHHIRMTSVPVATYGAYSIPRILYEGWINVPANSKITAFATGMNQLNITSIIPLSQQNVYYDPNNPYGYGNNGYGYGYNGYGYGNNGYGGYGGYPNYGYGNYGWFPPAPPAGMPAADFENLKKTINNQSFESNKLDIAKQATGANHLTAQQVLELTRLFDFESTKVEYAKLAYGHTVDRNNFYLVNDAFDYSSSVTELSDYINSWHA